MNDYGIIILGGLCFIVGLVLGTTQGTSRERQKQIEYGVAEWRIDPVTAEKTFYRFTIETNLHKVDVQ